MCEWGGGYLITILGVGRVLYFYTNKEIMKLHILLALILVSIGCGISKKTSEGAIVGNYKFKGREGLVESLTLYESGAFEYQKTFHLVKEVAVGRWHISGSKKLVLAIDTSFKRSKVFIIKDPSKPSSKVSFVIHSVGSTLTAYGSIFVSDGRIVEKAQLESSQVNFSLARVDSIKISFNNHEFWFANNDSSCKKFQVIINFDGYITSGKVNMVLYRMKKAGLYFDGKIYKYDTSDIGPH